MNRNSAIRNDLSKIERPDDKVARDCYKGNKQKSTSTLKHYHAHSLAPHTPLLLPTPNDPHLPSFRYLEPTGEAWKGNKNTNVQTS